MKRKENCVYFVASIECRHCLDLWCRCRSIRWADVEWIVVHCCYAHCEIQYCMPVCQCRETVDVPLTHPSGWDIHRPVWLSMCQLSKNCHSHYERRRLHLMDYTNLYSYVRYADAYITQRLLPIEMRRQISSDRWSKLSDRCTCRPSFSISVSYSDAVKHSNSSRSPICSPPSCLHRPRMYV